MDSKLGPVASTHRLHIAQIVEDLPAIHHSKNQSSSTLNAHEINQDRTAFLNTVQQHSRKAQPAKTIAEVRSQEESDADEWRGDISEEFDEDAERNFDETVSDAHVNEEFESSSAVPSRTIEYHSNYQSNEVTSELILSNLNWRRAQPRVKIPNNQ